MFVAFRQIDQGKGSTGGQKQSLLPCGLLDGQQQFIVLRLGDLVQPSADQFFFQFRYYTGNGNAVKSHNFLISALVEAKKIDARIALRNTLIVADFNRKRKYGKSRVNIIPLYCIKT